MTEDGLRSRPHRIGVQVDPVEVLAVVDDGVVIKSSSVNPDGTTATATLNITTKDKDHFSIAGTDRVVGDTLEDDFEITVTRRPPTAGK